MKTQTQHTPTPWKVIDAPYYETSRIKTADNATDICEVRYKKNSLREAEQKANAAFIKKAVNAHKELIAILECCLNFRTNDVLVARIKKALAQAKGA